MNRFKDYDIQRIKSSYTVGTRVILDELNDPYSDIERGTKGTVMCVDDVGTIHINWDTGQSLGLIVGLDKFRIVSN